MEFIKISLLIGSFGSIYAGSLPVDFHFKKATDERTSFISQYKEYTENKILSGEFVDKEDSLSDQELRNLMEQSDKKASFLEQCRKFIVQAIAYLSMMQK